MHHRKTNSLELSWLGRLFIAVITVVCCTENLCAQQPTIPFSVRPLFDTARPATLGLDSLPGQQTYTIFSPGPGDFTYNHGVVLFPFKGMLYAQWQTSPKDEDEPGTQVVYSYSQDGIHWCEPVILTPASDSGITTCGGWWSNGDTLVAYINMWPAGEPVKQGYTVYRLSTDGIHWSAPAAVTNRNGKPVKGVIEQDLHALPGGRLITAFHQQPGLIATPYFTDDPLGITGWQAGEMEHLPGEKNMSRELEPAWFYRKDSALVMVFRDQAGSFKKLAALSKDRGVTWSRPVLINTPDSRAKQSAGNLPNGMAFMVNNPSGNKNRFPLVLTLSKDGFVFDKAWLLRAGGAALPPLRFPGKYKRPGYSYPKSVVWGDYLYIAYATNKETVQLTRVLWRGL